MGLSQIVKVASRLMRWRNPFQKGAQEASDQYVGKKAKLTTFEDLTYATDLDELAEADRESVAQFRAKKMGITGSSAGSANKDRWVCDDMTINSGNSLPAVLLALVAGGAAVLFLAKKEPEPAVVVPATPVVAVPATPSVPDSEYEVLFYDKDGNRITVPRLPPEMKRD
jgi:hypothetical protein